MSVSEKVTTVAGEVVAVADPYQSVHAAILVVAAAAVAAVFDLVAPRLSLQKI